MLPNKPKTTAVAIGSVVAALGFYGCKGDDTDWNTDRSTDTGTDTEIVDDSWAIERVEELNAGVQIDLAISASDEVALAYYVTLPTNTGLCEEAGFNPPPRLQQAIRLARKGPTEDLWRTETVDEPIIYVSPIGLSVAYDGAGNPALAYAGGPAISAHCGANDAVLSEWVGGAWSNEVVVATSGEATTGSAPSDSGTVVGYWPALAYDSSGNPAFAYKDVHFGTLQRDDTMRADAEFVWRQGGWSHEAVDFGEGAGDYMDLVFDAEGRPVLAYVIDVEAQDQSRRGVWISRRETDGTWTRAQLAAGFVHQRVSIAKDALTGELAVAYYWPKEKAARVRRLLDPERFAEATAWQNETIGDVRYDEGYYPSLTYAASGELLLAYHRCRSATAAAEGCNPAYEAVILARREVGGTWRNEVVRSAATGSCGEYTRVGADSTGRIIVAYRCTIEVSGEFEFRVFVASKSPGE